jgi:hypothetical protein
MNAQTRGRKYRNFKFEEFPKFAKENGNIMKQMFFKVSIKSNCIKLSETKPPLSAIADLCELNVYNSRRKFILAEKTRSAFINN